MDIKISLFVPIAILLFFSCKNDPNSSTKQPTGKANVANTVRIRIEQDAQSVNPLLTTSAYGRYIGRQIFQTLGVVDPTTLELKPLMIKEMPELVEVKEGAYKGMISYQFEFLEEAVWDNGTPITGHDWVFTVKAILNPLVPVGAWKSYFEYLKDIRVDAENPKRFTVYLSQYYILGLETLCQTPILAKYHFDPKGLMDSIALKSFVDPTAKAELTNPNLKTFADEFATPKYMTDKDGVSGSGAYQLESIQQGEGVILVRKGNYWGDKALSKQPLLAAYPEKLVYRVISDEPATETLLRNDELDIVTTLSSEKFLQLSTDPSMAARYSFDAVEHTTYNYLMLNNRDVRFSDRNVRQALAFSIDYDFLVKEVGANLVQRTNGPIHPLKSYYAKNLVPYSYDLNKSKDLLAASGWNDMDGDGILEKKIKGKIVPLKVKMLAVTTSMSTKKYAESVQESARKVGFDIEVVTTDLANLVKATKQGDYEIAVLAAQSYPGPDDLYPSFHSKSLVPAGDNRTGFVNKDADRLLERIRTEPDMESRTKLYHELQAILHTEVPAIYLNSPKLRCVTSKRFNGVISSNRPGYYEHLFQTKTQ